MKTPFVHAGWVLLLCCAPALSQVRSQSLPARGNSQIQNISIPLRSFEEVPSISSAARGTFHARVEAGAIRYKLSYSGLQGDVRQAHIHFGQKGVNGGVSVFLCQTTFNTDPTGLAPTCPQSGEVDGLLLPANVVGPGGQGITAGEFAELVAAIRHGVAYVNVHSTLFPGGEVRGQLDRDGHGDH
ncbi:MAG TPA: CHRD domain-containing protein [Pseudoxanthomonas sp.]